MNDRPSRGMEIGGIALSLIWVLLILVYVLITPPGSETRTLGLVMTLLMVFLPIALIWAVVITLRSIRELRAEAGRLQATVDAMRSSYVQTQAQIQAQPSGLKPSVERKIDEIAASTKEAETVLATFTSRRDASLSVPSADRKAALVSPRAEPAAEEPTLALGTPAEDFRPPLSVNDFIRALQFPGNARGQRRLPRPAAGAGGPDLGQADPRGAGCADAAQPGRHLHGRPAARPVPPRTVAAFCRRRARAVDCCPGRASGTEARWP